MTPFARIALIGFGEVGQILADDLLKAGVTQISAFDVLFGRADSIPSKAAAQRPVVKAADAASAVRDCELVLCAVTAASDLAAAQSVAATLPRGAIYIDLNSASPGMKKQAAAIIDGAGGRYVEAAVMTPFPPKRIASPMLLGGAHAQEFLDRATPLGFSAKVFSTEVGKASATKMCRSVMIKGLEALVVESYTTARAYGVEDHVLPTLKETFPSIDWSEEGRYFYSRVVQHGKRRAEEMREAANTVREAGFEPLMAAATAQKQDWVARLAAKGLFEGIQKSGGWQAYADRLIQQAKRRD